MIYMGNKSSKIEDYFNENDCVKMRKKYNHIDNLLRYIKVTQS